MNDEMAVPHMQGAPDPRPELAVRRLGTIGYAAGVDLQERLVRRRRQDRIPDTLLLLEHHHVITLGSGSTPEHVLASPEDRILRGIELHESGRGGDVTYHGPGQLIGYPILRLEEGRRDLHAYLRDLEEVLIRALRTFGVDGGRKEGLTGVWVGDEKIAAIGIRVSSGWITSHGFALNVNTDLSYFETIVPCGIRQHGVCSVASLLGADLTVEALERPVVDAMGAVFGRRPVDHASGSAVGAKTSSSGSVGRKSR